MHCRTTDNEFQVVVCCSTMHRAIGRLLKRTRNIAIAADAPANEWKHYVKVGLQGHRVRDEADLQARIRAFQLDPANVILMYHLAKSNLDASLAGVSAAIAMFLVLFNNLPIAICIVEQQTTT